jgi:hypothetical protein
MGSGERRFKETPPPASLFGHHLGNALMYEIAQTIIGTGASLRVSGVADETGGWGQLKDAIQWYINQNEVRTLLDGGVLEFRDHLNNVLDESEVYGAIGYHKIENIIRLTLVCRVRPAVNTNYIRFTVPTDYRAFGSDLGTHPLIKIGCTRLVGSTFTEFNNIYTNMTSISPPLNNHFYIGDFRLVSNLPTSTVFPALGGAGDRYIFGINYDYRRAGI